MSTGRNKAKWRRLKEGKHKVEPPFMGELKGKLQQLEKLLEFQIKQDLESVLEARQGLNILKHGGSRSKHG